MNARPAGRRRFHRQCPLAESRQRLHYKQVMTKCRKLVFLLACISAIGLVCILVHTPDPVYQGHRLSEWMGQMSQSDQATNGVFHPSETDVRAAILALGTNNLPLLAHFISFDSSKSVFIPVFHVMPLWFNRLSVFDYVGDWEERGNGRAYAATEAFKILGPAGTPAIPQLADILWHGSLVPGANALRALGYMGEPALPTILIAANLTNCPTRYLAIRSFWAHTNNPDVYRFLTNALADPNPHVSSEAADALKGVELY